VCSQNPVYLTRSDIVELHDRIVAIIGGMPGVRDEDALESCVAQPMTAVFGHERFATVYEKAAAICFYIVRTHPFFDGNKRTGLLAALHFLLSNGVDPDLDEDEVYTAITRVARGESDDIHELVAVLERRQG
jgi:death-on-curing protein